MTLRRVLIIASLACTVACRRAPRAAAHPTPPRVASVVLDVSPSDATAQASDAQPQHALSIVPRTPPPAMEPPGQLRWIAAGGGATPDSNQVSLAQDITLAREMLGNHGAVLFASGHGAPIQILDHTPRADSLLQELSELFDERPGRDAHYEPIAIPVHGEATAEHVLDVLQGALREGSDPLLLYVAAHGNQGSQPRLNTIAFWGDTTVSVEDLAQALDETPTRRPLRMIVTSCFGGAFADIVFRDADPAQGTAASTRCGFFAAPWNHEATGCDSDPDRRQHENYALYLFRALHQQDREGRSVPIATVDLDRDGRISLLEAHSIARIRAASIDMPNTTSERWLRQFAPRDGVARAAELPEEDIVIRELSTALSMPADLSAVQARIDELHAQRQALGHQATTMEESIEDATRRLSARLLARWPVLDDPWHPDFGATMQSQRAEIAALLAHDTDRTTWRRVLADRELLGAQAEALEVQESRARRLERALETRLLAARLQGRGGNAWRTYQALLACERSSP